jgi:type II secretory pathway predicted ATPase ExeA
MNATPPNSPPAALDLIGHHLGAVNPFFANRSNGPSRSDVDVAAIHQQAFEQLTTLARQACEDRRGTGAVLWGQAGTGKSHLLSRLARWSAEESGACFVYLHNLQASPEQMPRSVLHAVISVLTQGRTRHLVGTHLFELIRGAVIEAVDHDLSRQSWVAVAQRYGALVERLNQPELPGAASLDYTPFKVLFRLLRSSYRTTQGHENGGEAELAVRWLAGQPLDPTEARRLELSPRRADEAVALEGAEDVKQVLVALTRLATVQHRPFLLVFDQVDNLEEDQAAALARFLQAVLDSSAGLLVVTAGVHSTLLRWREKGVLQESAWDRLAQTETMLLRLTPDQAVQIVQSRLDHFWSGLPSSPAIEAKRKADPLFPLGRTWWEEALQGHTDVRPRDVISWAQEGWRRRQEELAQAGMSRWLERWPGSRVSVNGTDLTEEEIRERIDRKVGEKLEEIRRQLKEEAQALPPDGDHLAGLVFSVLSQLRSVDPTSPLLNVSRVPAPRAGARPAYDLSLQLRGTSPGEMVTTGVLMLTATNAYSVQGFLRRLSEDARPLDRLLLVTDARVGLPLGVRGKEYLDQLRQSGSPHFRRYELGRQEYGELEAMQRVVGLARSGDLEIERPGGPARTVSEGEAVQALHRLGRYAASPLLGELVMLKHGPPAG